MPDPFSSNGSSNREQQRSNPLAVIRRHIGLILLVLVATTAPTIYLSLRETPSYTATARIRISDVRRAVSNGVDERDFMLNRNTDLLLSQLQVLQSRKVAGGVVDREGLRLVELQTSAPAGYLSDVFVDDLARADTFRLQLDGDVIRVGASAGRPQVVRLGEEISFDGVRFRVESLPQPEVALAVATRDDAISSVLSGMSVYAVDRTDVVSVSYTSSDALLAQRVATALAEVFQEESAQAARLRSQRRRLFLEEQFRTTDSMLVSTQMALSAFRNREKVYSSREKFSAQQQGLMSLDIRREELLAEHRMYQRLLNDVIQAREDGRGTMLRTLVSSPGIAGNPVVSQLYNQLATYEAERESITTGPAGSTSSHPSVQRLDGLIANTQDKIVDAAGSHVESLEARLAALDDLRVRSTAEISSLPQAEAEELRLTQEHESLSRIADQVRADLHHARMVEAVEAGHVEILETAPYPHPGASKRGMKVGFGMLLGIMLGVSGAFVLEARDRSIRKEDELEDVFGAPGLAVVPRIEGPKSGRSLLQIPASFVSDRRSENRRRTTMLPLSGELADPGLEAYRVLRANLVLTHADQQPQTIVVTSVAAAEGKTTTATNLALAYAARGSRVLLIDCDTFKPRVHELFDVPLSPGLADELANDHEKQNRVHRTTFNSLCVMPAGRRTAESPMNVDDRWMGAILETYRSVFDLIILDTPPLSATADATVLSSMVDGVVLVIRAGRTERADAEHAARQLARVGAKLLGTVLNDPDAVVRTSNYYDYYQRS